MKNKNSQGGKIVAPKELKPSTGFSHTGGLILDQNTGALKGWDSIYSHLNAVDRKRAEDIAQGMIIDPPKRTYWRVCAAQPNAAQRRYDLEKIDSETCGNTQEVTFSVNEEGVPEWDNLP